MVTASLQHCFSPVAMEKCNDKKSRKLYFIVSVKDGVKWERESLLKKKKSRDSFYYRWKVELKTLKSQIKCHTERFPQWLISLSEKKKNQTNCVFRCFFCWITCYALGDPKGSPPLLSVANHVVLVLSAQSQAAPAYREHEKITEKPQRLWGTVIVGGDYHFTFYCTLFWGNKASAVQFFALQSALLSDFRTNRAARSLSWKISHVWKGAEDGTGREKASRWAWIASLIWFGFILACGVGNVLTACSNARIRWVLITIGHYICLMYSQCKRKIVQ